MFRLNGDIVKQLKKIYSIHFKDNYRKELKERIVFFVNNIYGIKSLNELKLLTEEIVLQDFEIIILKEDFFNKYQEELLNSFNPIWYSSNKKIYSEEEIGYIVNQFIYEFLSNLEKLYVDLVEPDIKIENVSYDKKLYKQMSEHLFFYIKKILSLPPFRPETSFQIIYNFEEFLHNAETGINKISFNEFINKNYFYISNISSKEELSEELLSLYYLNKVLVHLNVKAKE